VRLRRAAIDRMRRAGAGVSGWLSRMVSAGLILSCIAETRPHRRSFLRHGVTAGIEDPARLLVTAVTVSSLKA
jgi:hypothetical protein